ncbi:cytidine deaminase [Oscillibacter sp.]|uniref:cytidine deaminase n=1 Tax=Oscillibacter sp. TaxID=1945593 RepID=UPI00262978DB|nr:cytidine deaminase [Oscillibacter sp.]MDD3346143.1 cytidine deaminase [Oscillibacter sp.]
MTREELKAAATSMLERAYCPYSHFPVGAALECADGSVFTGCNIENAGYSPTICAERTAVAKAVSEGRRDFVRIAVAGRSEDFCVPCGVCRQVLQEFAPDMEVICLNGSGEELALPLKALLPYGFDRSLLPDAGKP